MAMYLTLIQLLITTPDLCKGRLSWSSHHLIVVVLLFTYLYFTVSSSRYTMHLAMTLSGTT